MREMQRKRETKRQRVRNRDEKTRENMETF